MLDREVITFFFGELKIKYGQDMVAQLNKLWY